ncbi:glycosyl hydrolase family 18 protein [Sediminibacterium ginsengisoli]|uniref:chitinase n=1 Tax=Sediminibacterium ginsengisoli TaxID=413434 RepID=A0A1T4R2Q7_9BACT|nr:glycosyl hydrolase family 18 protein [Sediminibacterium ginsengisoli]SKA10135.1 Chitinase, GH18 family [Sediminibacterium ginsengisoli]
MRKYYALAFAVFVIASCGKKDVTTPTTQPPVVPPVTTTIAPPPSLGFYVVGYIPSYRDPATIADNKYKMCNVINYAFASVTSTGGLSVAVPARLTAVQAKAKTYGAKIMISVNGSIADWKNMAATPAGRTSFVKLLMNTVRTYSLDGVDIDWEYPSTSDGTDITYTALMKELSDSCHTNAKYYVSTALTSGKYVGAYTNAIRDELLQSNYIDFYNIMAYDDFNTSVPYRQHSDYTLAQVCLNYWMNTRKIPSSRVVLGMPAYGRPSGITQTGTVLTYADILSKGGSSQSDSAVVTAGGFTNYTIYYNGQFTIKKKAMLAKNSAAGIMLWEMGQDTNDANSLWKAACDTLGRAY